MATVGRDLKLLGRITTNSKTYVTDLICLHDGSIVACSFNFTLIRWPDPLKSTRLLHDGKLKVLNSYEGHSNYVNCVTQINSEMIASSALDGKIRLWKISTGECLAVHDLKGVSWCIVRLRQGLHKLREGASGREDSDDNTAQFLAMGINDGSIITCRVTRSGALERVQHIDQPKNNTYCLCELDIYDEDYEDDESKADGGRRRPESGPLVAAGSLDPKLRVWDASTGAAVRWFYLYEKTDYTDYTVTMTMLRHNRSSSVMATASKGGIIQLWNNEDLITSVQPTDKPVYVSNNKTPFKWNSEEEKKYTVIMDPVRVLKGHRKEITKLIGLPDGSLLSGSSDGTIRLWDADTGECLMTVAMEYEVRSMALLSNRCSIAVGGSAGRLEIFRMTWLRFDLFYLIAISLSTS